MKNEPKAHGYGVFARFYDELTQNVDYCQIADYYLHLLESFGACDGELLDLACGTGSLTEKLSDKSEFSLTATDLSADMLSIASAKIGFNNVRFLQSDMRKLRFNSEFDAIICGLDSLNHLANLNEIEKTFQSVKKSLKVGGLFAFDMNSVKKHREILGDNTFIYDAEGVFCTWQNEYSSENEKVQINLDFFVPESTSIGKNYIYKRYQESFCETAYPIDKIEEMLIANGFELLCTNDYLTTKKADESVEKFTIVARKV